jgi:Zn-dependent protease with chaperone function
MNASVRFVVWGSIPIAALLAGWLGSRIGLVPTMWLGGLGSLVTVLPVLRLGRTTEVRAAGR